MLRPVTRVAATLLTLWVGCEDPPPPSSAKLPPSLIGAPSQPAAPGEAKTTPAKPPTPPLPEHGSAGCGKAPPHEGRGKVVGEEVYLPASYDSYRAHPLLIVAHHKWDDPGDFMMKSGFPALADVRHFVVVAPNNGNRAWEQPARFLPALETVVQEVKAASCIDERRVFVVGHSRGGRAALAAACEPWVAGVAVNSYLPKVEEYQDRWWCDRATPTLWLSPSRSHMVRLDGERGCVSPRIALRDFESAWRARNSCQPTPTQDRITGGVCRSWSCGAPFKSCELDGGHYWPGMPPNSIDVMNCEHQGFEEPEAPRFAIAEQVWSFFETVPVTTPSAGGTSTTE